MDAIFDFFAGLQCLGQRITASQTRDRLAITEEEAALRYSILTTGVWPDVRVLRL